MGLCWGNYDREGKKRAIERTLTNAEKNPEMYRGNWAIEVMIPQAYRFLMTADQCTRFGLLSGDGWYIAKGMRMQDEENAEEE